MVIAGEHIIRWHLKNSLAHASEVVRRSNYQRKEDMDYTTTIPVGKIDEDELLGFVERLQKITGQTLIIEKQYAICTNDLTISTMLDSLKEIAEDATRVTKVAVNTTKIKARSKVVKRAWKKGSDEPKPEPKRGPSVRSIKIEETGEMINRAPKALIKQVAAWDAEIESVAKAVSTETKQAKK